MSVLSIKGLTASVPGRRILNGIDIELNSGEVQGKLTAGNGRARMLAADDKRPDDEKLRELFTWVYARPPVDHEMQVALAHVEKHKDNKAIAYEDILWALINTKEFLFNH